MSETSYDPLLKAARWLTIFFLALTVIVGAALSIAAPALLVANELVVVEMVAEGYRADFELVLAIAVLLWLIAALMAVGFFFRNLLRIIGSVGEGDPFAPVNADRLRKMGWLAVIAQVLAIPAGAIGAWIQVRMEEVSIDFDLSLTGILLALILFILARVFRHGAAMREDLEGTV